jgi:redox-sensing transcriptional repressor
VRRIADSTVRRLSLYLRFLEESAQRGLVTISSDELARRGGTTSAQVRKDLSFFGSFGKRGLGYSVPELTESLREILGLRRDWQVIIVGAGKIGTALAQYRGFRQRGFRVVAVYDRDPKKIGTEWDSLTVRDMANIERDIAKEHPDIAVLATPAEEAQAVVNRLVQAGIRAVLNFAPIQIQVPADVTLKNVNMAMELEGLSFALTNRDR